MWCGCTPLAPGTRCGWGYSLVSMSTLPVDDAYFARLDTLKVPMSAPHQWSMELIGLTARDLLGSEFHVFLDMNWYHLDYPYPVAPDVMAIPAEGVEAGLRSYRQGEGASPTVVVEIPSENNSAFEVQKKNLRYRRLGVVSLTVYIEPGTEGVFRQGPDDWDFLNWTGRPVPELGGLVLDFDDDGALRATTPAGFSGNRYADVLHATLADELAAEAEVRADAAVLEAEARAGAAEAKAKAAESKAEALMERLRAAGIDPD